MAKADREDVDAIGRRLEQGLDTVSTDGEKTAGSLREQLDRLHMLLNFKVDSKAVQARSLSEKVDIEGRLARLETGVRKEQKSLKRQLNKLLERMKKLVGDVVADREVQEQDKTLIVPVCDTSYYHMLIRSESYWAFPGDIHTVLRVCDDGP